MMIEINSITPPPQRDSVHLMADFVELQCIANPDGEITASNAASLVYEKFKDEDRESSGADGEDASDTLSDRYLLKATDWFNNIENRMNDFGRFYPFTLDKRKLRLHCNMTNERLLYVFLLICTNLRIVDRSGRNPLTTAFEQLSANVMEAYLPSFDVHGFGKNISGERIYPAKLYDAIKMLAQNLNEKLICEQEDFGDKNTGDGGLDLVAYKKPCCSEPGSLICFAQAACGPDGWKKKQYESSYEAWKHYINFMHPPANFMFTPVCYRNSNGKWENKLHIHSILIDRYRICQILSEKPPSAPIDFFSVYEAIAEYQP